MYNLIGTTHNEMDGSFCYGFLQFLRFEWGARGMICIYGCHNCGAIFRNVE